MKQHYQKGNINFLLTGLIVIAGLAAWQLYQMRYDLNAANQKVESLSQQVTELHATVTDLQNDVQQLESSSIKGVVREANNAILTGWEALITTVEQEIKKVRDDLEQDSTMESSSATVPPPVNPQEQVVPSHTDAAAPDSVPSQPDETPLAPSSESEY